MTQSDTRIAADYNRTLAAPVRWAHRAAAWVREVLAPLTDWAGAPSRRLWAPPMIWAAILAVALVPLDGTVHSWAMSAKGYVKGDLRRELEMLQQYGDLATLILTATIVALVDRARRARLLDLAVAAAFTGLVVTVLKMLIGRPRPEFFDPRYFLGPLGSYPIDERVGVRHAWEFWSGISSKLWSMPSSHTSAAVVLSVFLVSLYPRLRPLAIGMPILVGLCRVLFTAHYLSDVVVGALVGLAAARPAVAGMWGVRLLASVTGRDRGPRADDSRRTG